MTDLEKFVGVYVEYLPNQSFREAYVEACRLDELAAMGFLDSIRLNAEVL